jgi:hypothetical protein
MAQSRSVDERTSTLRRHLNAHCRKTTQRNELANRENPDFHAMKLCCDMADERLAEGYDIHSTVE